MPWARRHARISKRADSPALNRRLTRRRRLLLEPLEPRRLLAHLELSAIADGLVADRDLDGTFETALDGGTSILDRWFAIADIGQERGVFEFDLTGITAGATVSAAKIGLDFTSRTTPGDPGLVFRSYSGDGIITVADGDAVSAAAQHGHKLRLPGPGQIHLGTDRADNGGQLAATQTNHRQGTPARGRGPSHNGVEAVRQVG